MVDFAKRGGPNLGTYCLLECSLSSEVAPCLCGRAVGEAVVEEQALDGKVKQSFST